LAELILAHDLGTTGNKASLFDRQGRAVASAFAGYEVSYPRPGWAEQDAEDWWQAIAASTRELLADEGIAPSDVAAVTFSGQMMGCLLLDAQKRPLRSALIWADTRATAEAETLKARVGAERFYRITGHRASSSYTAAKFMWLKAHQPELVAKARHCLLAKDYGAFRLCGELASDYSDASGTNLFDLRARRWSDEVLAAAELPAKMLPPALPSAAVIGGVTAEASRATGLLAGTPVVIGGGDGACATAGAGVVSPGDAYNYIGSSSWIAFVSQEPLYDPQQRTFTFAHLDPDYVFPTGTMQCAGGSFDWVERLLRGESQHAIHGWLIEAAGEVSPGCKGLLFLPYLMGERSPHWNPQARGAFVGLSLSHGRAEMTRAVLEGVMFNLRIILEAFRAQGAKIPSLRLIGGGARSHVWRQIAADVLGVPIERPELLVEATSLGAAAAGGVGVGLCEDYAEAGRLIALHQGEHPTPEHAARYDTLFPLFESLYADLCPAFERASRWSAARREE